MKSKNKVLRSQSSANKSKARVRETFWKNHMLAAIIVFLAAIGLYLNTTSFDYALDDQLVIRDNTYTNQGFAGIHKIFTEESFTGYFKEQKDLVAGSRYRPLSMVTFAIEKQFFQSPKEDGYGKLVKDTDGKQLMSGNPAISHFLNALFYALTALLLFRVLGQMFPAKPGSKWYFSIPFAATLLFVVHPLHTEVVANIKGRDEIMSLFFSLAALYYTFLYVSEKSKLLLFLSLGSFFLALLSKENALTFLVIIPLTIYFFTDSKRPAVLGLSLPLLIVSFVYLVIRFKVIGYLVKDTVITDLMNNPFIGMSFGQKMATVIYTLGLYVKLLFIPHPLTHDYYPYTIPVMSFSDAGTLISIALYLVLAFVAWKGFRSKNPVSYSILFFFITLSIASNLVLPVGTFMNERFVFVSSLGFCITMAYLGLEKLPALLVKYAEPLKIAGLVVIVGISLAFSVLTINRIPAWKNNLALNRADIITSANSARENCYMSLGLYHESKRVEDTLSKIKFLNEANAYLHRSLEIFPGYGSALQMLSANAAEKFMYDKDVTSLLKAFAVVLQTTEAPQEVDNYLAWMNRQGRFNEQLLPFYHKLSYELLFKKEQSRDKAEKYCQMGLKLDPANAVLLKDLREIQAAKPSL